MHELAYSIYMIDLLFRITIIKLKKAQHIYLCRRGESRHISAHDPLRIPDPACEKNGSGFNFKNTFPYSFEDWKVVSIF